jgi:hypothetical protein
MSRRTKNNDDDEGSDAESIEIVKDLKVDQDSDNNRGVKGGVPPEYKMRETIVNYSFVVVPIPSKSPTILRKFEKTRRYRFLINESEKNILFERVTKFKPIEEKKNTKLENLKWSDNINFNVISFKEKIMILDKKIKPEELTEFIWSLYFYLEIDSDGKSRKYYSGEDKFKYSYLGDLTTEWAFLTDSSSDEAVGLMNECIVNSSSSNSEYASIYSSRVLNLERNGGSRPFINYTIGIF